MKYDFSHKTTHPNGKIIEDKVNYFADYFEFTYTNWGHCFVPDIENHKSLLEKVVFQLENYTVHSNKFIFHYLNNRLLTLKDPIIKKYYKEDWSVILKSIYGLADFSDPIIRKRIIKILNVFISKLNNTILSNSIDWLVEIFQCKHPLEKHNHQLYLNYITSIILSEFFYAGFTKEDLGKIFNKIFSKEIKIENGKPRTEAPLPESLHKLKYENEDAYFHKVSEFLKSRTLKQQFEGIYNFYKNEQKKKTFIFQIEDIGFTTNKTMNWKYNNVLFSNDLYRKNVKKYTTRKEYAVFFENKEVVYAQVTVNGINNEGARINAIREVTNATNYLMNIGKCFPRINQLHYIVKDKDSNVYHRSPSKYFHPQDRVGFEESNIYLFLKSIKSPLAQRLKEIEAIYILANSSIYQEVRLVNYWRYLECFFEKAEDLQKTVSLIVANNYYSYDIFYFLNTTHKIFRSSNNIGTFDEKFIKSPEFVSWIYPNSPEERKLEEIVKIVNHPYLAAEMRSYLNKSTSEKIKSSSAYIKSILFETYEQRNFIEHDGRFNEKAVNKLLLSLATYVGVFRWQLIQAIKQNTFKSFHDIIEHLKKVNSYPTK